MSRTAHPWRFARTSGLDQVRVESGADLEQLHTLDPGLWVALACPVKGLEFDARTLALMDSDADGRIRQPEVLAAIAFCQERLIGLDSVVAGGALPLARLNAQRAEGQRVLATARRVLAESGHADAPTLTVEDALAAAERFAASPRNGDGVITPGSTADPALAAVLTEALATVGGVPDRSGAEGLGQAGLDAFFAALEAVSAWHAEAEADPQGLLPLGEGTAAALAALEAVEARVGDYFARCHLAAFDAAAQAPLNPGQERYAALAAGTLSASSPEVAALPLARVAPGEALPLGAGLNPAWRGAVDALVSALVRPVLGEREALSEADWAALQARLAPHRAWLGRRPDNKAHALGLERVRALLAQDPRAALAALVAEDSAEAGTHDALVELERLARYHRDLFELVNNFTSFRSFYAQDHKAVFQAGTLILDGRACELVLRVLDAGRVGAMGGLSACFLATLRCTRGGETLDAVAVFSGGDAELLMPGRNGVFWDRQGRDWDATITGVVQNPISVGEAFWTPYRRFARMVEGLIAGKAAAADPAAPPAKLDLGSIALIGVAVSGAAAVVGGLLEAFFGLGLWMPLGLVGIVMLISGPSMLMAALKLRRRNLGPLLDANGWAINARVRLNIPFGGALTRVAVVPPGAERSLEDPFRQARSPWVTALYAALVLLVLGGALYGSYHRGWLPAGVEGPLATLGVPKHLVKARDEAAAAVEESRAAVGSAQERLDAASRTLAELEAQPDAAAARVQRARARVERADARLARAEDRLEQVEQRLEAATEALEVAMDLDEARQEAAEAGSGR